MTSGLTSQFVYPFTLEPHVVTLESSRRTTVAAHTARREAYLRSRDDDKERRRRDALRRIAPGFEPHSGPLVPTRNTGNPMTTDEGGAKGYEQPQQQSRSAMDDLVDQLAALDSATSSSYPLSKPDEIQTGQNYL